MRQEYLPEHSVTKAGSRVLVVFPPPEHAAARAISGTRAKTGVYRFMPWGRSAFRRGCADSSLAKAIGVRREPWRLTLRTPRASDPAPFECVSLGPASTSSR